MRHRKTVFRRSGLVIALLTVIVLTIGLVGVANAQSAATIQTDKNKYSLGETMVISGSGFAPSGTVSIEVQLPGNNGLDTLEPVATGADGAFQTTYNPPMIPGRYKITATDGIDTAKTAATEADAIGYGKGVYRKDTTAIVLPTGKWMTGNAGKYYKEDQWAYYQYEITGIPGSDVPTFNVIFNHYQPNTNAIFIDAFCDFRYAWNTGMLPDNTPYPGTGTSTWHTWLPNKINWAYSPSTHTLTYPSANAPAEFNGFAVDDPSSMFATGAPTTGTNTLVIYFRAHLASSTVWMAGDEANLGTLVPPDDAAVPSGAAGIYGEEVYSGWNASFYGVGFASGSSRHFNLQDQSAGSSGAISLPIPTVGANYLIIQKVTDPTPAAGAVFNFTASSDPNGNINPTTFTLDTDPGTTSIYDLIRFSDLPTGKGSKAVDYIFTEATLPAGWSLTDITCEDILGSSTFTIDLSSKTVTVRLDVDGAAICTFNNTRSPGCLNVTKVIDDSTVEDGDLADLADALFSVNVTGPSYPGGEIVTFNFTDGVLYVWDEDHWVAGDSYCLCGLIPGAYNATEEAAAGWEDAVISGSPATVAAGDGCEGVDIEVTNSPTPGCLNVTKVVDLDEYPFAGSANSTFAINVTGPSYPGGHILTFNLTNGVLEGPDNGNSTCLCNLIPGNYTVAEIPPLGWNLTGITPPQPVTVEAGTECGIDAVEATVTNTLLIPHTSINITADFYETTPGGNVWLHICDTNDGEVPLTNNYVELWADNGTGPVLIATLNETAPEFQGTDDPEYDVMDVNEIWCWDYQVTLWTDTTLTVNGHGIDPLGNPVAPPTYPSESRNITIQVGNATRTWGFWKTHLFLVNWMLDPAGGNITLPIYLGTWASYNGTPVDHNITNNCTYMGLMWSDQSKNSETNGRGPREKIDQARIHTAHQALAAIMNDSMAGGANLLAWLQTHGYPSATDARATIADILTNGNEKQIRNLGSVLAGYNESGDDEALDPSLPPTGKTSGNIADPQGGRSAGEPCEPYWDTPQASKGKWRT